MASLNKVTLIGRLGKDPEIKTISNESSVARFTIATSEKWTDKHNEKKEQTDWHLIVTWNNLASYCSNYLNKGDQVYLEGKIRTRSWEQDGTTKYITEIIASSIQKLTTKKQSLPLSGDLGSSYSTDTPF